MGDPGTPIVVIQASEPSVGFFGAWKGINPERRIQMATDVQSLPATLTFVNPIDHCLHDAGRGSRTIDPLVGLNAKDQ